MSLTRLPAGAGGPLAGGGGGKGVRTFTLPPEMKEKNNQSVFQEIVKIVVPTGDCTRIV